VIWDEFNESWEGQGLNQHGWPQQQPGGETPKYGKFPGWFYRQYKIPSPETMEVIPVLFRSFKQDLRVQFPWGEGWIELLQCKVPFKLIDWVEEQRGTVENCRTYGKVITSPTAYVDRTNLRLWGLKLSDAILVNMMDEPVLIIPSHGEIKKDDVSFPYD
jgi:hypothetical protein